jgi:hypothetical protein
MVDLISGSVTNPARMAPKKVARTRPAAIS